MKTAVLLGAVLLLVSCNPLSDEPVTKEQSREVSLPEIARMISSLPLDRDNVREVHDAVSSSSGNGYDSEYMMKDLLTSPGSGVGDLPSGTKASSYPTPIASLIRAYLSSGGTKSSAMDAEMYIKALEESGAQIYWPGSEDWDGAQYPLITFDPGDDSPSNIAYEIVVGEDGSREVRETVVTEEIASSRPVWVINSNEDSQFKTIEVLKRDNPQWGEGGDVHVKSASSEPSSMKMLVLKELCAKRNFDPWYRGGNEFFVKCGFVSNFTASTEAELKLFSPSITDFMIVVRRGQIGKTLPFNVILATNWTEQQESVAFMMTEDDGGSWTTWKLEAVVKVSSKSYGVEVEFPFHENDDIVWRGSLSYNFFMKYDGTPQHFGDMDLTFAIE